MKYQVMGEFFDTLEQVMHGKEYIKINVLWRFFKVRIEECK